METSSVFLLAVLLLGSSCVLLVEAQVDGSFWWTNSRLMENAKESRNNKKVDFKGESPRDQSGSAAITSVVPSSEEYSKMDCTCEHECKCQVAFDFSQSGSPSPCSAPNHVCCHIIKLPLPRVCFEETQSSTSPPPTSSTTPPPTPVAVHSSTPSPTLRRPAATDEDVIFFPATDERVWQYPFLLKLFQRHPIHRRICGATLIGNDSAVTAQHCIRGSRVPGDFFIETLDGQRRLVTEIIGHPQYYSGGLYNDLAVLRWTDPLQGNAEVDVVDLATKFDIDLRNCSVVSFASAEEEFELEQVNEKVHLLEDKDCENQIKKSKWGNRFRLHSSFSCIDSDRDQTCSVENPRDGHPVICSDGAMTRQLLVGIISWYNCHKLHPDVTADIRANYEWIRDAQESESEGVFTFSF